MTCESSRFQSAPPLRGATSSTLKKRGNKGVSIRAPLARGDEILIDFFRACRCFNPRPPCEGRPSLDAKRMTSAMFQSAPPLRGATTHDSAVVAHRSVSIRAPLARGDSYTARVISAVTGFNPRPPCEGRPEFVTVPRVLFVFQSAPPLRGATAALVKARQLWPVSIRAPLARGDNGRNVSRLPTRGFNPRPPCEGRPDLHPGRDDRQWFQSAPPLRGATLIDHALFSGMNCFNPRPPCEGRRVGEMIAFDLDMVSIRAPLARGDSLCI